MWYNSSEVRKVLITSVVQNEAERNERMIAEYRALLSDLPKGSLICRKNYYYLKYRDGNKIYDKYIGKDPLVIEALREKLELRRHYTEMLSRLEEEQKVIQKVLEGIS